MSQSKGAATAKAPRHRGQASLPCLRNSRAVSIGAGHTIARCRDSMKWAHKRVSVGVFVISDPGKGRTCCYHSKNFPSSVKLTPWLRGKTGRVGSEREVSLEWIMSKPWGRQRRSRRGCSLCWRI